MSAALVHYDAMRRELDACHSVDEIKEFRNKALALETYARVANDHEAERKLAEVRIRAERSAGAMLRDMDKAKGAAQPGTNRGTTRSADTTASKPLSDLKISKQQSSDWQKVAAVPEEVFEKRLADPYGVPSTAEIIRLTSPAGDSVAPAVLTTEGFASMAERATAKHILKILQDLGRYAERINLPAIGEAFFNDAIIDPAEVRHGGYVASRLWSL